MGTTSSTTLCSTRRRTASSGFWTGSCARWAVRYVLSCLSCVCAVWLGDVGLRRRKWQLADLANFTQPWAIPADSFPDGVNVMAAFKNNVKDAPIAREELEQEYCRVTHQPYPIPEMVFAQSWMLFRVSVCVEFSLDSSDVCCSLAWHSPR